MSFLDNWVKKSNAPNPGVLSTGVQDLTIHGAEIVTNTSSSERKSIEGAAKSLKVTSKQKYIEPPASNGSSRPLFIGTRFEPIISYC